MEKGTSIRDKQKIALRYGEHRWNCGSTVVGLMKSRDKHSRIHQDEEWKAWPLGGPELAVR